MPRYNLGVLGPEVDTKELFEFLESLGLKPEATEWDEKEIYIQSEKRMRRREVEFLQGIVVGYGIASKEGR